MNGLKNTNPALSPQRSNGNLGFIDDTVEHNDTENSGEGSGSSGESSDEDDDDLSGTLTTPRHQTHHNTNNDNYNSNVSSEPVPWKSIWKGITIEPMMFAHMFAMSTTSVVLQNLYIERICTVTLEKGPEICGNLSHHHDEEKHIDAMAAKFVTYRAFIEAGFPIIISLFLGPWTDIHGTKWPMILPLFGYFLSATSYFTLAHFPLVPPEVLLISSIPVSLTGGLVSILMSAFSFMSKNTDLEHRSFRVAMLEASWFLGGPIGILSGGLIYKFGGFVTVFATSATIFLCAFTYGFFIIREEMPEIADRENGNCCTDMFNIKAVKDMFSTVFMKRNGLRRRWLLIMIATICLRIFAMFGYLQTMYLYTKTKFDWDVKEYSEYSVSDSFIAISGGYIMIMTCMKIFKLSDAVIGILSTIGIIFSQFVFAFAAASWMIYLGASLQMFAGLISIVLRAMISKIVAKEEIARVFTFLACGEASMPLIGVPLYSLVFYHTTYSFPGAMFFISAGTYSVILMSFTYLYVSMKRTPEHVQMENPTESTA